MTGQADAQRMVLSSAFHYGPAIWEYVSPSTLDDPYRRIGLVLQALAARGTAIDVASFVSECLARNLDPALSRWMMGPVKPDEAHEAYVNARGYGLIEASLIRAQEHLSRGVDHWRVMDDMVADLHAIPRPASDRPTEWWTWDEILAMQDTTDQNAWVLPDMLRGGERVVMTGAEGHGKSTLIYQLAMGAAYGVSPLDTSVHYKPCRVMILDVENWHETQVLAHMRTMKAAYGRFRPGFTPEVALLRARVINLLQPEQRRSLLDAVDAFQPDLLIMGSGYKLVDTADDWRVMATSIQRTADEARARSGCAIIIETHAGHGHQGDRNMWRPDGSSYWLRWPEFGLGLQPIIGASRRMARVHRWRGDRVADRQWPAGWRAGGLLPWTPMTEDEMDALESM